jgi:hypothetical protein
MLKKVAWFAATNLINFPIRVKEFISIKFFKIHLKFKIIQSGNIGNHVVMFVMYPGTTSLFSLKRSLDSLSNTNFSILVVINKNDRTNEILDLLSGYEATVLLRPNIGRDIGAYQCGLYFLGGNSFELDFEKIALINDSLYVTKHTSDFYERFLMSPNSNCIYMNNQDIHHASSHSLILDKKALNSRNLINFWTKYYPSSIRSHSIFKGEFGITLSLGKTYFKPLINHTLFNVLSEESNLSDLEKSQIRVWSEKSGGDGSVLLKDYFESKLDREAIYFCLDNFQVSNSLGLYLYRALKVPIKLDICKYKLISEYSFIQLLGPDMELLENTLLWQRLNPFNSHMTSPVRYYLSKVLSKLKQYE